MHYISALKARKFRSVESVEGGGAGKGSCNDNLLYFNYLTVLLAFKCPVQFLLNGLYTGTQRKPLASQLPLAKDHHGYSSIPDS